VAFIDTIWHGLSNAFLMAWQVWWALAIGYAISALIQAWAPPARVERALGNSGPRPVALASALGAASSSCSYAAIAIAKSLFSKGASAASALAFQFASTNLVVELGIVTWVLIGWQFTLAELLGGIVAIAAMTLALRLFVSRRLEARARAHAVRAETGHEHHASRSELGPRERLTSVAAWSDVAHNYRHDWTMSWKEITAGFVISGFIGLLGDGFFNALFVHDAPGPLRLVENVVVGPLVAVLSFVCSVGNIPLAAVLWSGGAGFAAVVAFIFADLIVIPIVLIYRKYYGGKFALRIVALMFLAIVLAALAVDGIFSATGLIPHARPARADIFSSVKVDYKLVLNVIGTVVFVALFALTRRRGVTDPVCGMKVDRARAIRADTAHGAKFFCSEHCRDSYAATHNGDDTLVSAGSANRATREYAEP
jgi:uncharacterized protein